MLNIDVEDGQDALVPGFLYLAPDITSPVPDQHHHQTASVLLSGAGGGTTGPSSICLSFECKLAMRLTGVLTSGLNYGVPARNKPCVQDVKAAMQYPQDMCVLDRSVLVSRLFGGAPVCTVGGEEVVDCATFASQTVEMEEIRGLTPRPVLLLRGTVEGNLSLWCS